jgi:hypothetical protein
MEAKTILEKAPFHSSLYFHLKQISKQINKKHQMKPKKT